MIDAPLIQLFTFFLSNISFEMMSLSLIICLILTPSLEKARAIEFSLSVLLFLCVGVTGLWGFTMHAFFPAFTSHFIGWSASPFEFEVALANLGLGLTGIMAVWKNFDFRLAVIISVTCFLWGAAAGHLYQLFYLNDHAQGNSGTILYTDILIPALLWLLVAVRSR